MYFADSTNTLSWADMRARTIRKISDNWLNRVKRELEKGEEILSMGVTNTQPTLLRCLCGKRKRLRLLQTAVEGSDERWFSLRDITSVWDVGR